MSRTLHFPTRRQLLTGCAALIAVSTTRTGLHAQQAPGTDDPLPAWNDGPIKSRIIDFVVGVATPGSREFVPVAQRIATFDNDGTLWPENPVPFELAFAFDRVKAMALDHPDWSDRQPYKAVLENDMGALAGQGPSGLAEILLATHAGMTTDEFDRLVEDWMSTARHPRFNRPYAALAYQPMLELLALLRSHSFKLFIVSGGGAEFMRVFSEGLYGIPPEQVVGTLFKTKFEMRDDVPSLVILPQVAYVDDKAGKPVAIQQFIGRRPIAAFGNSDGDLEMLQLTTVGRSPSLGLLVHHTDGEREYAYDSNPKSSGKLIKALEEAPSRGWAVVDMRRDWRDVFKPSTGPAPAGGRALR